MICCQSKYPIDNNPHSKYHLLPLIFKQKFTLFFFFIILNLKKPSTGFSKKIEFITATFSPDTNPHYPHVSFLSLLIALNTLTLNGRNQINSFHLKKTIHIFLLSVPASSCVSIFQVCFFLQHHMGI